MFDQVLNGIGNGLLGADQHIDGDRAVGEQFLMSEIGIGTYTGDLGWRTKQGVRHLAGDHVDFIGAGNGNQQVSVFTTSLLQHRRIGGCAGNGADIEPSGKLLQPLGINIHQGDIVVLLREVLGECAANLAGT